VANRLLSFNNRVFFANVKKSYSAEIFIRKYYKSSFTQLENFHSTDIIVKHLSNDTCHALIQSHHLYLQRKRYYIIF